MSRPYPDGLSRDLFAVRIALFGGGLPISPTTSSTDVLRTPARLPIAICVAGHISAFLPQANLCRGVRVGVGDYGMKDAVWAICERVAEVQALIEDHLQNGKYQSNEVPWLINEILSEDGLREAMLAVGYLLPKPARH